jgi:uncharacterized protein
MGVELRPRGVACNIACRYCYQNPQREAANVRAGYDLERMKAAVSRIGGPFTLFGGEPLLMPIDDLEHLLAWGRAQYGKCGIQTNGTLITDAHVALFRRYDVSVGISIDGPGELNDARWNGNVAATRAATDTVERVIEKLAREWLPPGLIVTLHRANALAEHLPAMHRWFEKLDELGIASVRLHVLEVDGEAARSFALSDRENVEAMLGFAALQRRLHRLRFDTISDIENLLVGDDAKASCVWHACDPFTTAAVQGVEGDGRSSNCGRTNKDGVDFPKAEFAGYERYLALAKTPYAYGGCSGCRFFIFCKGQCPGTAIEGDWRNRTEHCGVWYDLFAEIEESLIVAGKVPLSIHPVREAIEAHMVARWEAGANPSIAASQAAVSAAVDTRGM